MQKLKELLRDPDWKYPPGFPVNKAFTEWKNELYKKDWVVYTKKPFAGVKSVVEYLGRYSHRVAITNQRIRSVTDTHVSFSYKDYRTNGHSKLLTLEGKEFLRRFSQHILPCGFRKVRHFGFIANASKAKSIKTARQALHVKQKELLDKAERRSLAKQRLFKKEADKCPSCKTGVMRTMEILSPARAPPSTLLSRKRVKELLSNY